MLLSRMYAWRGYGGTHVMGDSPNSVTFTATSNKCVVGTLTLNVDSDTGLAADNTFAEELAPFRAAAGAKLCELTKFAFDWTGPSHQHLAALFHLVFIYGSRQFACSDLFIEVNPRHRRYYETMLGFSRVGEVRINASVNAPSQLMWLNVGAIRQMIDKHTKSFARNQRSLYRYFFSPDEEDGLFGRLIGAPRQGSALATGAHHHPKLEYSARRLLSLMVGTKRR
nr:acetyltransferase [uncultured Sphingomonas sp.]